jgi:hypothetical protein
MTDTTTDKLERGVQLLEDAGSDRDLLGVALLAFQGALAEQLRSLIATNPSLGEAERSTLDRVGSLSALVELGRRHGDLTREQAWQILEAERLRSGFARGEPFRGSPSEVRTYARFVAELCNRADITRQIAAIPTARLAPVEKRVDDDDDDDQDLPPQGLYHAIMRWVPGLILLACLALGALWLFRQVVQQVGGQAPISTATVSSGPEPTFAPLIIAEVTPTSLPTPTIAARRGRIVRLGSGPGWLHQEPNFESPTLPIRLSEGQEVALLDERRTDSQGTPWVLISAGGYNGWSPENNVEAIP